ncbi:hypothetical protein F5879DRAFT_967934 [Lentinula edodes]|nr:hypothetical protein F5879DRAFT_967934 [Lentinula edodes]
MTTNRTIFVIVKCHFFVLCYMDSRFELDLGSHKDSEGALIQTVNFLMKPVQHFTALIQFDDPNSTTLVILPTLLPEPEALLQPQDDIVESRSNTPPCHHSADRTFARVPADGGTDGEVDAVVSLTQQRYAENADLYGVSIANLLDSVMPMPAPLDTRREAMEVQIESACSDTNSEQTMAMDDIASLVGDAQRTDVSISQNPQHLADQRVSVHQRYRSTTGLFYFSIHVAVSQDSHGHSFGD